MSQETLELALAVLAFVVWLVRLEAKAMYNDRQLQDLKINTKEAHDTLWAKLETVTNQLTMVMQSTSRIEGSLLGEKKRGDNG